MMRSKEAIEKKIGEYHTEYTELNKKGGKGSPVDTPSHFRKLGELSMAISVLNWVLGKES